ncbi:hypothetical protein BJY00DRAFT_277634 [Aspergillus carlsbadensis]|nr:hypothetical protein BJY00DRAFT_277634 [Aspergillus carlsbadensis]
MNGQHHRRPLSRDDFDVAIICALCLETNAVLCALDEFWDEAPHEYGKAAGDANSYAFGRLGRHAVVVVTLPLMGKIHAASAASTLKMSFNSIKLALLVGICGAVPFKADRTEITLGDVIISEALVEFDFGREHEDGFERRRDTMFEAPRPPEEVAGLLNQLKTPFRLSKLQDGLARHLEDLMQSASIKTRYPVVSQDRLFEPTYIHKHQAGCDRCSPQDAICSTAYIASCEELGCERDHLVPRSRLPIALADQRPTHRVHFGSIGTADTVMRSAKRRDELARKEGIIAFEMEGAGLWTKFNCLIIKGVCDYADSHKNKDWQGYAAAVAAAAAKEVLRQYAPPDRPSPREISDSRSNTSPRSAASSHTLSGQLPYYSADEHQKIFDRVLGDLEARFSADQVTRFRETDLPALKRELGRTQREQNKNKELRNLRRLEKFIEKFDQFGQVLQGTLGDTEHMGYVWGPVKHLLMIARGHSDLLDALLSAYEKIGDEMPTLGGTCEVFKYYPYLLGILARLFVDLMEFHEKALELYSGRALKAIFTPLWQDYKPMFQGILNRMTAHTRLIEDKTRAIYNHPGQYELDAREIDVHLQQLQDDASKLEQEEDKRKQDMYNDVLNWFADTEPDETGETDESKHGIICRDLRRYPGSGRWILDTPEVKKWLSPDPDQSVSPILWIHGRPGTGKTYLASVIIEECKNDENAVTCYFYCEESAELKTSAIAVLRGILAQLVKRHQELAPYCRSKRKTSGVSTLTDLSVASTLIETFCERVPRLYIVIDGLDECEKGLKDLLVTLKNLVTKSDKYSPERLRVLLLSRTMTEIMSTVPDAAILPLKPSHNSADIKQYCQLRSRELQKFDFSEEALDNVLERICIQADGMFLFAKLVINNLRGQRNRRAFYKEISPECLPTKLNEAYDRIMKRLKQDLHPSQFECTQLLLGWLECSKRPLKWTEVKLAFSIDMNTSQIRNDLDMDLKLRDDAEELCGSLVQVFKGNRVELVHTTAKQFIRLHHKSNNLEGAAECDLTVRCLRYLTLDIFRSETEDTELRRYAKRGDLALQDYAVPAWPLHIRTLVEQGKKILDGDVMSVDSNPTSQEERITHELQRFVHFYAESLPEIDQPRTTDCESFESYPFYEDLVRIWEHICTAQRQDLESRNKVSLAQLSSSLTRNREVLEDLSQDPTFKDFTTLYDAYPFRCPKLTCFWFQEGFSTAELRTNHENHHNMPCRCPVESCNRATFGFRSKNEVTTHMKRYHPEDIDLSESFTNPVRAEVNKTRWECPECHGFFVRKNILEDHIRAHRGEKPFCCRECGKGFTRKSDMKRHEKIHEKRR